MPADIDNAAGVVFVVDYDGGAVLYGIVVDGVGEVRRGAARSAEEEVEDIDAMRSDVIKRTAARHGWIETPGAVTGFVVPVMILELGQQRPADRALLD